MPARKIKHDLPFSPTYDYNLEQLLAIPLPDNACNTEKRLSMFLTDHFDHQYPERKEEQERHEKNCRKWGIY